MEAVLESEVYQSDIRVKDRLKKNSTFHALHRYLTRDFFDSDVVGDLSQKIDVGLDIVSLTSLLIGEQLALLVIVCLLDLAVEFNHFHYVFEPLC